MNSIQDIYKFLMWLLRTIFELKCYFFQEIGMCCTTCSWHKQPSLLLAAVKNTAERQGYGIAFTLKLITALLKIYLTSQHSTLQYRFWLCLLNPLLQKYPHNFYFFTDPVLVFIIVKIYYQNRFKILGNWNVSGKDLLSKTNLVWKLFLKEIFDHAR